MEADKKNIGKTEENHKMFFGQMSKFDILLLQSHSLNVLAVQRMESLHGGHVGWQEQ